MTIQTYRRLIPHKETSLSLHPSTRGRSCILDAFRKAVAALAKIGKGLHDELEAATRAGADGVARIRRRLNQYKVKVDPNGPINITRKAPPTGGAARRARHGSGWPSGDLNKSVREHAGDNPNISITNKGKRIYETPDTGVQVVEDMQGGYYRIYDPSLPGKRKYLDLSGDIPNNKLVDGRQVGRPQAEYNQVTHFIIE